MDNKKFGLTDHQYLMVQNIFSDFLKNKNQWQVFVFGSRARGDYKKYSDLDLWISTTPGLTPKEVTQLNDIFEDSDLPITVDIVTPENVLSEYVNSIEAEKKSW